MSLRKRSDLSLLISATKQKQYLLYNTKCHLKLYSQLNHKINLRKIIGHCIFNCERMYFIFAVLNILLISPANNYRIVKIFIFLYTSHLFYRLHRCSSLGIY